MGAMRGYVGNRCSAVFKAVARERPAWSSPKAELAQGNRGTPTSAFGGLRLFIATDRMARVLTWIATSSHIMREAGLELVDLDEFGGSARVAGVEIVETS